MCSGEAEVNWDENDEKEWEGAQNAAGLGQIYENNKANTKSHGPFVKNAVHSVLLKYNMDC